MFQGLYFYVFGSILKEIQEKYYIFFSLKITKKYVFLILNY